MWHSSSFHKMRNENFTAHIIQEVTSARSSKLPIPFHSVSRRGFFPLNKISRVFNSFPYSLFFSGKKVSTSRLSRKNKLKIHAFRRQLLRCWDPLKWVLNSSHEKLFHSTREFSMEKNLFLEINSHEKMNTFRIFNSIWFIFIFNTSTFHIYFNFFSRSHSTSTSSELKALKDILK